MAEGAWVPAFDSIWRHRKITRLVRETQGIPMQRRHAVGGLYLELMSWAREAVETGDLGTADPGDLAAAVGLPRHRGTELLAALKAAELVSNDARAHVAGWEDGPGKLVASRRQARERQRAHRERNKGEKPVTRDASTKAAPSGDLSRVTAPAVTRDVPVTSRDRVDKTRVQREESPPPPTRDADALAPDAGDRDARLAWFIATLPGETWRGLMRALAERTTVTQVETWFAESALDEDQAGGPYVVVKNAFAREWVETKYTALLTELLGTRPTILDRAGYAARSATEAHEPAEPPVIAPDAGEPAVPDELVRDPDQPFARVRGEP